MYSLLTLTISLSAVSFFTVAAPTAQLNWHGDHQEHGNDTYHVDQDEPVIREYFYAGGQYTIDQTSGQHFCEGQMYVEHLTPKNGVRQKHPLVLIHGQGETGTNWLNKPDGGAGWASYFLRHGYSLYLIDQPYRARSPWNPASAINLTSTPAESIQRTQTAVELYNNYPQSQLHTQWPGNGTMGDPVFDFYYSTQVQYNDDGVTQQLAFREAVTDLLQNKIGEEVVLMGHSQGGIMLWVAADANPNFVHGIIALEPSGPPFEDQIIRTGPTRAYGLTDIPIAYDPPVNDPSTDIAKTTNVSTNANYGDCILQDEGAGGAKKLVNLQSIQVIVVTTEASYHAQYDWCTVQYLEQAGIQTEHLALADEDINGNGHMMFMELNSDEIVGVIEKKIRAL